MIDDLFETRGPDCPSELTLDQLQLGELPAATATSVRAHAEACPSCGERLSARAQGLAAFPQLDAAAVVARIHQRTAGAEPLPDIETGARPGVWARLVAWASPQRALGALALAAVLVVGTVGALRYAQHTGPSNPATPPGGAPGAEGDLRTKGGPALEVLVHRQGATVTLMSGDAVSAAETLQLAIVTSEPGHVLVVGSDGQGPLYAALPLGASTSLSLPKAGRHAGTEQLELEGTAPRERLFAVWCPQAFTLDQIHIGASGEVSVPAGCAASGFDLLRAHAPAPPR